MKIIHVTPSFWPRGGGVEMHVGEVAREQLKNGDQVYVLTRAVKNRGQLKLSKLTLKILAKLKRESVLAKSAGNSSSRPPKLRFSKLLTWRQIWRYRDQLRATDQVVIHDVFWWIWPVLPLIYHKLTTIFHGWEGQHPVPWRYKLHRWVNAKLSTHTVHVGDWIREFYWDRPSAVTYGGVKINNDSVSSGPAHNQQKFPHFIFLGRLEPENEVAKYLELIVLLKQKWPQLSMTWVGDGSLRQQCEQQGNVTGWVVQPAKYLPTADLVFCNSYLSLLETQAAGKVAAALYSHPLKQRYLATYPGSNFMLSAQDISGMNQQIVNLLSNKIKLSKLSQQARNFAKTRTWQQVNNVYYSLWQ
jgi:glycosyltransferase involved in cell wall biosynthesis